MKSPQQRPRRQKKFMDFMNIKRHRRDNDAPYLAGGVTLSICSIVSIVLFGASWVQYLANSSNNFAAVVSAVLVDLANADRMAYGTNAGQLAVNEQLVRAAQAKANDMALKSYFSHVGPDGREPWAWIKDAGYDYQYAGENLAVRFGDSLEVEHAWLASPLHRANLLDSRFTEVGIATAYGMYQGEPTTFVVQMFGTPRKAAAAKAPAPKPEPVVLASADAEADAPAVLGVAESAEISIEPYAPEASRFQHFMASPKTYARYGYAFLALLVLLAGGYALFFEIRQRHFKHGTYAVALSFALLAFLYVADAVMYAGPEIAKMPFPIAS